MENYRNTATGKFVDDMLQEQNVQHALRVMADHGVPPAAFFGSRLAHHATHLSDHDHRMIGKMVKEFMVGQGYSLSHEDQPIKNMQLFKTAATYHKD